MTQILLRGNRRFGILCVVIALIVALAAGAMLSIDPNIFAICIAGFALVLAVGLCWFSWNCFFRPRLAITSDELLVNVTVFSKTFRVPLDAVEVFFMGQGAVRGTEPGHPKDYEGAVAANVIVRLAEAASEWHNQKSQLWLAVWDDGYITIRGLWCEDIQQELLKTMNKRLAQAKRQLKEKRSL